jgi:hypothetical protein
MHSILARLGADVLVGRMNRMREDERVKLVGPDSWVLPCPTPGPQALDPAFVPMYDGETEIWFDWAFVDFWKANNRERFLFLSASISRLYMIRYDSTGDRGGSGVGIVINGYVYLKLVKRRSSFLILFHLSHAPPPTSFRQKQRRVAKKASWSLPFVGSSRTRPQRLKHCGAK